MVSCFIIMCVIITTIDFYVFYLIGSTQQPSVKCTIDAPLDIVEEMKHMQMEEDFPLCEEDENSKLGPVGHHDESCAGWEDAHVPYLRGIDSKSFEKFKGDHFVDVRYVEKSTLVTSSQNSKCTVVANPVLTVKNSETCSAVVRVKGIKESFHLLRYDSDPQFGGILKETNHIMPTGFFRKASNLNGRLRIAMKMNPLFKQIHSVDDNLLHKLTSNGFEPNSDEDIIVMVVNDGELDMFMNFVCSCKAHGITLERVLVFCGSQEIVPLIEVTGAMGFYHSSFAAVNRAASEIYLDRTFVDMMWYKAFSVWLVLRLHYNVLFQDVDLVWFKEPLTFLRGYVSPVGVETDTFWSDDGQRGLRYSPFYGNSGFYYIRWNPRTEYWAWSCITAFDTMHTSGSHQNVITTRMMENMDFANVTLKILDIDDFPTGVKYHHDKPYMARLAAGEEKPFNFHMCWTSNKGQKVEYFKKSKMWYLQDQCEKSGVMPHHTIFQSVVGNKRSDREQQWKELSSACCMAGGL